MKSERMQNSADDVIIYFKKFNVFNSIHTTLGVSHFGTFDKEKDFDPVFGKIIHVTNPMLGPKGNDYGAKENRLQFIDFIRQPA